MKENVVKRVRSIWLSILVIPLILVFLSGDEHNDHRRPTIKGKVARKLTQCTIKIRKEILVDHLIRMRVSLKKRLSIIPKYTLGKIL